MDGHGIIAMIAPRHVMISNGYTDHEGVRFFFSPSLLSLYIYLSLKHLVNLTTITTTTTQDVNFADEMNVVTASQVFELLNASSSLQITHRPGDHHGFIDVDSYFDFFDMSFHRNNAFDLENRLITPAGFDFQAWLKMYGSSIPAAPSSTTTSFRDRVDWLTQYRSGEIAIRSVGSSYSEDGVQGNRFSYRSVMMMDDFERDGSMLRLPVSFGRYLTANIYWPSSLNVTTNTTANAVIWLHPYSYATGFVSTYGENSIVQDLVHNTGSIVLAFDQIGFGTRIKEGGKKFYDRYGSQASLFGHMIQDVFHAVDFLMCRKREYRSNATLCSDGEVSTSTYPFTLDKIPNVGKIFVAGYSLGGNVALHAASLDDRIDSVASFAGFTPFRTDSNDRSTYGIRRLYDLHGLLPRLGLFRDNPSKIPYDYDEVLENIAPRSTLIHAPEHDRDATFEDVRNCLNRARVFWGSHSNLLNFSTTSGGMTQMSRNESLLLCDWVVSK